jgi:hypothetical protein
LDTVLDDVDLVLCEELAAFRVDTFETFLRGSPEKRLTFAAGTLVGAQEGYGVKVLR